MVAGNSPGKAALIAFGPGMGDPNRGHIMYEAGHRLDNGTEAENVAAIRAFLNFSFDAPTGQVPVITENTSPPNVVNGGDYIDFDVTGVIPGGGNPTYQWTTSCNTGSFDDATSATPRLTFANPTQTENCIVTVVVEDSCGRQSINSWNITVVNGTPTAPTVVNDNYSMYNSQQLSFNPLNNDFDVNENLDPSSFTTTSSLTVAGGTFVHNGNGNITFIPVNETFTGTAILNYQVCDTSSPTPLCSNGIITIEVLDNPCGVGELITTVEAYAQTIKSQKDWKKGNNALDAPDNQFS